MRDRKIGCVYSGVGIINPQLSMMITLIEAGTNSLSRACRVRGIAKEYNLISLDLCAEKRSRTVQVIS
jgi:hypothetical protein